MTQRLEQPGRSRRRTVRRHPPAPLGEPTSEPTLLGFPAEYEADIAPSDPPPDGAPTDVPSRTEALTVVRRTEPIGAAALVLAGTAANVSLLVSWSTGEEPTGLTLVQRGAGDLDAGLAESVRSGVWEPLVVVLCGGLMILLGLALLVPARAHRFLGVLALVVALAAAAALLVLVAEAGWATERFGPGMWCAVAVPVLGLLGALKAMLTAPRARLVES